MDKSKAYTLCLYEKALPGDWCFEKKLDSTRKCGFDNLEISIDESDARLARLDWSAAEMLELRRAQENSGVPITTMCLSGHRRFPLGSHDAAIRERSLEIMAKALDFSAETGVRLIQLAGYDVYYEESDSDTAAYFVENLAHCVEMAAGYSIALGFETMETPFIDTTAKAMKYVELIGSPWLGVYPDIGNMKNAAVIYGHDVVDDLATGRGHIFAAHLKETSPGVYRNMSFGSGGHTEYSRCLKELWSTGVRKFTGEFWYLGGDNPLGDAAKAAAFLRGKIEEQLV